MDDDSVAIKVESVLADAIRRRLEGEALSDEAVVLLYPELATILRARLRKVARVEAALEARAEGGGMPGVPVISPRYTVLREINHGGQAVVYLARDQAEGRNVAIKVLRSGVLADRGERSPTSEPSQGSGDSRDKNCQSS